jgi:hypothetical protein
MGAGLAQGGYHYEKRFSPEQIFFNRGLII